MQRPDWSLAAGHPVKQPSVVACGLRRNVLTAIVSYATT